MFRSPRRRVPRRRAGGWLPGTPSGNSSTETAGSPTFLGNQNCALALLYDPDGTNRIRPSTMRPVLPPH